MSKSFSSLRTYRVLLHIMIHGFNDLFTILVVSSQHSNVSTWKSLEALCISYVLLARLSLRDSTNHTIHETYYGTLSWVSWIRSLKCCVCSISYSSSQYPKSYAIIPFNPWVRIMVMKCSILIEIHVGLDVASTSATSFGILTTANFSYVYNMCCI